MNSPPFPEIPCLICSKPVNLQTDLCADESGKAVHADCYIKRITGAHGSKPPIRFSPLPGTERVFSAKRPASC
jgi:hypothetical protein